MNMNRCPNCGDEALILIIPAVYGPAGWGQRCPTCLWDSELTVEMTPPDTRLGDEATALQATIDQQQAQISTLTLIACRLRVALVDANEAVHIVAESGQGYQNTLAEVQAALDAARPVLPLLSADPWLLQEPCPNGGPS